MNYFISDTHFGHCNALSFDSREFDSIEEHDRALIDNWNNVVSEFDDVWFLGDLSWHNATRTLEILKELNGIKHWIVGNHDKKLLRNVDVKKEFIEITHYRELVVNNKSLVLCHYPIVSFNGRYRDGVHFYGHVHNTQDEVDIQNCNKQMRGSQKMFNVGCMFLDYTPRTYEEIMDIWES